MWINIWKHNEIHKNHVELPWKFFRIKQNYNSIFECLEWIHGLMPMNRMEYHLNLSSIISKSSPKHYDFIQKGYACRMSCEWLIPFLYFVKSKTNCFQEYKVNYHQKSLNHHFFSLFTEWHLLEKFDSIQRLRLICRIKKAHIVEIKLKEEEFCHII